MLQASASGEELEIQLSWIPHVHHRPPSPSGARPLQQRKARSGTQPSGDQWTVVEDVLEKGARGLYQPLQMRRRRRPRPAPAGEPGAGRVGRPGVEVLADGTRLPCGRVTVVTPTTDVRQDYHEQLYAVFNAQDWPDKELVVIETHRTQPSPFFAAMAKKDSRVILHSMQIPNNEEDLSIGIKRNMGTHLSSGDWIASFDDDDLYAPSYLSTMLEEMVRQEASAITLGAWYIFEERSGMFGYVDCRGMHGTTVDLQGKMRPADRDGWLYGYGFSYVFSQDAASDYPFPDKNFGEDYDFFVRLKTRIQTALFFDDFGICVHTLHPRSTSSVQADQEVPREEVQDLDVVHLGELLTRYVERFPRRGVSANISHSGRRAERTLTVRVLPCGLDVALARAVKCTVGEVKASLAKAVDLGAAPLQIHVSEDCAGRCLDDKQRLGVRVQRLWARQHAVAGQAEVRAVGARVVSAGHDSGNKAEFYLGESRVAFKAQRGINVVSVDPASMEPSCRSFDVWGQVEAVEWFAWYLHSLPARSYVLVAVKDSGLERLSEEALRALRGVGATIRAGAPREGYALIGSKGGPAVAERRGSCVTAIGLLRPGAH